MTLMGSVKMDEKQKVYESSGRAYNTNLLYKGIQDLKKRIKIKDLPGAILIVAPPGKGKTTMICHIARDYQEGDLHYEHQLGNGFEDFQKKLQICRVRDYDVVAYDEGGDIDKRRFMSDTNYKIRRILQLARGFNKLLVMAIHDFSQFDKAVLNLEVIRFMVYIPRRNKNSAEFRVYSLSKMHKLLSVMDWLNKKKRHPSAAYNIVYPNYRGHFYNLPDGEAARLKEFSNSAKDDMLNILSGDDRGLYDFKAIAQFVGKSVPWVKVKVRELKIRGEAIRGKKKYFSEEDLHNILENKDSYKKRGRPKKIKAEELVYA